MGASTRSWDPEKGVPELPGWVEDLLRGMGVDSLLRFVLLCHLHNHPGRLFDRFQLPSWRPIRDGAFRETLEDLVARGILCRRVGRSAVSYTYSPDGKKREVLERFFDYLEDTWCRARVTRWIAGRVAYGPSGPRERGRP